MTINNIVFAVAGGVVLASSLPVLLAGATTNLLWITAFVGLSLFQSAFTGFCPLINILKALGIKD